MGDPIALLLAALSLAAVLVYLIVDLAGSDRVAGTVGPAGGLRTARPKQGDTGARVKTVLVSPILAATVLLPTQKLALPGCR